MGSPTIFNGQYAKLLTSQPGIINSNGSLINANGVRNYIANGHFNQNISNVTLQTVSLSGGLPTGAPSAGAASLAASRITSGQLLDVGSLQITAASAWSAGQGFSLPAFTVSDADLGKVLTFSFYYKASSGSSNLNWSGTLGSQSLMVYIYDVTASAWVQPAGFLGMNTGSGSGFVSGTFQSSVTSGQQYQLFVLASQASAGACTLVFDQMAVSPQTIVQGTPVTDWVSYTPTVSGTSNMTATGMWRRVGDNMQVRIKATASGALTGTPNFSIPAGYTMDASKFPGGAIGGKIGVAYSEDAAVLGYDGWTYPNSTTTLGVAAGNAAGTYLSSTGIGAAIPFTWANTDFLFAEAEFPVTGWSSNVQMSNDTDTRVVAFSYQSSAATSVPNNTATAINWNSTKFDTHSAVTTSTGTFTAPVSGYYVFDASILFGGFTSGNRWILWYKNGSLDGEDIDINDAILRSIQSSYSVALNAGDTVQIKVQQNSGSTQSLSSTTDAVRFSGRRLSGPSAIAASETVAAIYGQPSSQNLNSPGAVVDFSTKIEDTHGAVTTGASWKFTAPISGLYYVNCALYMNSTNGIIGNLQKNGSTWLRLLERANGAAIQMDNGSGLLRLNAGDYINVKATSIGATGSLSGSTDINYISIQRVGN